MKIDLLKIGRKPAQEATPNERESTQVAGWLYSCLTLATFAVQLESTKRRRFRKPENLAGETRMVIGIFLSGILAGLLGTIGGLTFGLPLWAALLLYPVFGTLGAFGFISIALAKGEDIGQREMPEFAAE